MCGDLCVCVCVCACVYTGVSVMDDTRGHIDKVLKVCIP